jgi:hypothetical protein
MKHKLFRLLIPILVVVALLGMSAPSFAATTQDVTITATPTYIALTNSEATWAIGAVVINTTYWWTDDGNAPAEPLVDGDMKTTITNTGSVAEDIDIHTHAATGGVGWAISLDETPAADEFSLRAGITGMANMAAMVQVISTDAELKDSLAASGTVKACLSLETGTSFGDGVAKSTTATLTASAAD